ncbi:putative cytochrome P450 E-class, group I [Cladorrhinum samala]|uniref:Cytochrome P450 E-class, group I n=1 Tax=Cladorrhinum samala TaxID=585594 RepID=A0AAV9HZV7_9PEZI|nr:putative cytochrome P450 E-class, group I [Cladorrhinum samala]
MTTILQLALGAAGILLLYLLLSPVAAYRRLRHIPGPAWAGYTPLWLVRRQYAGRLHRDIYELSKKYGTIFRIAPNWVSINDPAEIRRVWQARGQWYRGRWYDMFRFDQPGAETVLFMQDNAAHAALRSRLQPGYSGKDVDSLDPAVDQRIADFVSLIENKYLSTEREFRPMDLAQKAQFLTLDVISDLAIGKCFECLNNDRDVYGQIAFFTNSLPLVVAMSVVPASLVLLQNPIARALLPKDKLEGIGRMMGLAQENAAKRYGPKKIEARDMLGSFVNHGLSYTQAWLEQFSQIAAGSDTTATAVRMTLFLLMTNPESYRALQAEIDAAIREGRVSSPIRQDEAKRLPYLQAVIKEGMRVWPPVAGLCPKVCDTEQIVCGKRIPPGTNVCWDLFGVLRNKEVFGADADYFRPARWLEEKDADRLRAMEQVQGLCFATSSRWECLGKSVAQLELNKVFVEVSH